MNNIKTTLLLATLTAILVVLGDMIGGRSGQIVVSVTIKNGSIDDIQIKEAKNEDSAYFNNAKKIIDTMKQKQTADVDVASGATYSSKGIIAAVRNALKEAS